MEAVLKKVLACYDLVEVKIEAEAITYETNRQPHIWTVNDDYLLKMSENVEELKQHIRLSKLLKDVDLNTQTLIQTVNHEDYVMMDQHYFILVEKIKGEVLTDYFSSDEAVIGYEIGNSLGKLHNGLKDITKKLADLWDNDMFKELSGWVSQEFETYLKSASLSNSELNQLKDIKDRCLIAFETDYELLPRQVIHRDFHGGNLIFNEQEVVGYIDFDLTQINARLFDLCYVGTGSLASIFQDEDKRHRWVDFFKHVIKGYDDRATLKIEEKQMMKQMMIAIDLIMVAFFTRDGYIKLADSNALMINWIESTWEEN